MARPQSGSTLMCERIAQHYSWQEVSELYALATTEPSPGIRPRYKIWPTTTINAVWEVRGERIFGPLRWGLVPNWWLSGMAPTNAVTFNTLADQVARMPFFRSSFRRRHCLIPVSGYYGSRDTPSGKQTYYFTRQDGSIMTIAGLWDEWRHPDTNQLIGSCTMMIAEPRKSAAGVSHPVPVILEPKQFASWLSGRAWTKILKPAANVLLDERPVSKRVRRLRTSDSDATLIENTAQPEIFPQA